MSTEETIEHPTEALRSLLIEGEGRTKQSFIGTHELIHQEEKITTLAHIDDDSSSLANEVIIVQSPIEVQKESEATLILDEKDSETERIGTSEHSSNIKLAVSSVASLAQKSHSGAVDTSTNRSLGEITKKESRRGSNLIHNPPANVSERSMSKIKISVKELSGVSTSLPLLVKSPGEDNNNDATLIPARKASTASENITLTTKPLKKASIQKDDKGILSSRAPSFKTVIGSKSPSGSLTKTASSALLLKKASTRKLPAGGDDNDSNSKSLPAVGRPLASGKVLTKVLGASEGEVKRSTALKRMGVSEADVNEAKYLFSKPSDGSPKNANKQEKMLGVSEDQVKRTKALKMMNTTEDEVEVQRQRQLGELGKEAEHTRNNSLSEKSELAQRLAKARA
jgi:hypothetical protein